MLESCFLEKDSDKLCLDGGDVEEMEKRIDVNMLLNNKIAGFLPFQIQYIDERCVCSYDVKGTVSLEKLLKEKKADFFLAEKIYQGIYAAWRTGQEFLLEESHFVLLPAYLLWNARKEQLMICYFPGYQSSLDEQMTTLGQFILKRIDHHDKQCVSFVYGIYELIEREGFVGADIAEYLKKFERVETTEKEKRYGVERGQEVKYHTAKQRTGSRQTPAAVQDEEKRIESIFCLQNISKWRELPMRIEICQNSFTIGRGLENDLVIPAAWVSYHHARIDQKQSQLYVTDLGSVNGVYLNGKKLISNHPVLFREGDVVSFADVSYRMQRKTEKMLSGKC